MKSVAVVGVPFDKGGPEGQDAEFTAHRWDERRFWVWHNAVRTVQ
jgi:hypothetical protein